VEKYGRKKYITEGNNGKYPVTHYHIPDLIHNQQFSKYPKSHKTANYGAWQCTLRQAAINSPKETISSKLKLYLSQAWKLSGCKEEMKMGYTIRKRPQKKGPGQDKTTLAIHKTIQSIGPMKGGEARVGAVG
jgi:hypothetical protein